MTEEIQELRDRALAVLARLVGDGATFRPGQWEAIRAVVADRRKTLVVQRTGWGKSAVYLIATKLLRESGSGPTVIVSPLLALMRNQLEMADALELRSETVNSSNRDEWDRVYSAISDGTIDLLLISPERLNNPTFRSEALPRLARDLGLLVVDEVHCISDWGHDFRPDYRRLGKVVASLPHNVAVLGTTATANDRVVEDVKLQLGGDLVEIRGGLDRESLMLQIIALPDRADRLAWLAATIPRLEGSGIVYCLTIRDAERVGRWLVGRGIEAATYTSRSDDEARLAIEDRLRHGTLDVVVATSALGMGYDNPNIRFVIHYQSPGSPVAYYQQVGRAGRAVDTAYGVLLTGEEDRDIQDYFIRVAFPGAEDVDAVLTHLGGAGGATLTNLESVVNVQRTRLAGLLKILEVEGAVYQEASRWYRSASRWTYPVERIAGVTAARRAEQEAMVEYASTDRCLMQFLRRRLDDASAEPCGRCANCAGSPLPEDIPAELRSEALRFLDRIGLPIPPRKRWPPKIDGADGLRETLEEGRVLSVWGDPGWARMARSDKDKDRRFSDDLVEALAAMVDGWDMDPAPAWLTWVPAFGGGGPVADFALRLAARLGLPAVPAVRKVVETPLQKTMRNSFQQARNVLHAFEVTQVRADPVLLFDDTVDTRWTFTAVGARLLHAGSGPVYPVALVDTSGAR
ncbi:MAG: ATP-dependent DNA helicase RecQ [Actinobacteria bacterium]|nr:ATP-dependent DNA helicase RecQ [Actinomycetota bacterium]